jgi:hypothetical protein
MACLCYTGFIWVSVLPKKAGGYAFKILGQSWVVWRLRNAFPNCFICLSRAHTYLQLPLSSTAGEGEVGGAIVVPHVQWLRCPRDISSFLLWMFFNSVRRRIFITYATPVAIYTALSTPETRRIRTNTWMKSPNINRDMSFHPRVKIVSSSHGWI